MLNILRVTLLNKSRFISQRYRNLNGICWCISNFGFVRFIGRSLRILNNKAIIIFVASFILAISKFLIFCFCFNVAFHNEEERWNLERNAILSVQLNFIRFLFKFDSFYLVLKSVDLFIFSHLEHCSHSHDLFFTNLVSIILYKLWSDLSSNPYPILAVHSLSLAPPLPQKLLNNQSFPKAPVWWVRLNFNLVYHNCLSKS